MFMVCCLASWFYGRSAADFRISSNIYSDRSIVGDSRDRVVIFVYAYYYSGNYQPGV